MKNTRILLALLIAITAASCSDSNRVKLLETNAREEVPVLGNLTFVFNKNLAPDSLLNQWQTEKYITFTPEIEGRFRWLNSNELVFSPSKALKPATQYKAVLQKSLTRYTRFLLAKSDPVAFHTPLLAVQQATGMWVSREANTADIVPEITLQFNYKVKPTQVAASLKVTNAGNNLPFKLQSEQVSEQVVLRLTNVKPEDKDLKLHINLDNGILPVEGLTPTEKTIETEVLLPSPFSIIVSDVTAEHDGVKGTVKLFCSQQIDENQPIENFVKVNPSVKLKIETTDDGLVLSSSDFDVDKSYDLMVMRGLKGIVGGTVKEPFTRAITFGKLQPSVSFVDGNGVYMAGKGNSNLEVKIVNVPKIKVMISKIYENNLLANNKYGYYHDYYDDYEGEDYGDEYVSDYENTLGDVVYEKEINTADLPAYRSSRLFHFSFPDNLPDFKGIYYISIRSVDEYYISDSKYVSLSDLGLISRTGKDAVYVFANSIASAQPIGGVTVTAYGLNNQKIGTAQTNGSGYAEIPLTNKNMKGFEPAMITARSGNDFNYMPMSRTRVETSRYDIGGVRNNATGLRAFVYGDRDIYRPGETVHFSAVVRNSSWQLPGEVPVKARIVLPGGQELKVLKKTLNQQGSMESAFTLSNAAVSGQYSIEIYSGSDVLLTSKSVLVEEFMPDRIKVTTALEKKFYQPGEKMKLDILAENYFGPPASGRKYEAELQFKEKEFISKRFPDYDFNLSDNSNYYESQLAEGETDDEGKAIENFEVPDYMRDRGVLQADVFTTVFDENGRPVSRALSVPVYSQNTFYGIKTDGYGYYALNQPVRFYMAAVNKDDKPLSGARVKLLIIKHDYKTVLSKSGSYFRYESQMVDKTLIDKELILGAGGSYYDFVPRSPGDYEIRITRPGGNACVSRSFYSYGWWGNYGSSFAVNREGQIDISLDKEKYENGESARILFKTPFSGKMLVTLEQDRVISYQYVDVNNRAASLTIPVNGAYVPNVYVTATLIKPHKESEIPLTVAHGFASISVEDQANKLPVSINAAPKSRSKTRQKIKVKTAPGAKVTLAAVDEGILQITGFKTPDPYGFFYAKKALETRSYDLYPLLLPEIKGTKSSTGGDGFDLSKRVNPLPNKRVKLVSSWSGITDSESGDITFEVDIPQFSGEIRLMAVAYKNNSFGNAESSLTVADPLVISSGIPRFLSPGDTAYISVNLANTTEKTVSTSVKVTATGGLQVINGGYDANIAAAKESRQIIKITAPNTTGTGKIIVQASAFGESFSEETDITIRPASSLKKESKTGQIAAGKTMSVAIPGGYYKGSDKSKLMVSRSPVLQFGQHLNYLIQYPYGCSEQIVSQAFPQLYYADLTEGLSKNDDGKSFAASNVNETIRLLKMRQTYNGGITLWENSGQENWWATAYAAHFLLEAKQAGFEVDKSLLNQMLEYLSARVKQRSKSEYSYNRNGNVRYAPKEAAYSLLVLAIAGKPEVSVMNYYKHTPDELTPDSRFMLSAAYAIAGDKQKYREMLPGNFEQQNYVPEDGGSFASPIRDLAISLYVLQLADASNPMIAGMANRLSISMNGSNWLSTQERSFGLLALGKIARSQAGSTATAVVKVNGKILGKMDNTTLTIDHIKSAKEISIETQGNGNIYYFLQTEGIATEPAKQEDNYISIRRNFYDRYGREKALTDFKTTELIVIELTLTNAYSNRVENIVVTDLLPAGFEIENTRIKQLPDMHWIKAASEPNHTDVRDDRINLFVNLTDKQQKYYYAVRAVTAGNYVLGPVMADAMYRGDIYSSSGGGRIIIHP